MSNLTFSGFPAEGLQFLADLGHNNNRDWFEAHKSTFKNKLQSHAQAFVVALGERLQDISTNISYDTRLNGSGSLMRINRDTRFSQDKTPYKTNLSLTLWEGSNKKTAHSGFSMRIEATAGALLVGKLAFDKTTLAAYRQAVLDERLGAELEAVLAEVAQHSDYNIGGEHYKRVPRGFDPEHARAELLRYNGLHASYLDLTLEQLTSADLVDLCYQHYLHMAPLHQWLLKMGQGG